MTDDLEKQVNEAILVEQVRSQVEETEHAGYKLAQQFLMFEELKRDKRITVEEATLRMAHAWSAVLMEDTAPSIFFNAELHLAAALAATNKAKRRARKLVEFMRDRHEKSLKNISKADIRIVNEGS